MSVNVEKVVDELGGVERSGIGRSQREAGKREKTECRIPQGFAGVGHEAGSVVEEDVVVVGLRGDAPAKLSLRERERKKRRNAG